jgi:RHH-type proline utilization regulon transcriptional repressor/proline dehydrogenase/delta 1-pyrroline-5-carboxylate dehydrogenase
VELPAGDLHRQIAAALAAGNSVLAKPAEQTPLIAQGVAILLEAGVPPGVLQLLPAAGKPWRRADLR